MAKRSETRVFQQSAVRIFGFDAHGHPINLASNTLDISRSGARLKDVRCWDYPGEIIGVRHDMDKARFRIVWVGSSGSAMDGQVGLQCVDAGRYIFGTMPPEVDEASDANGLEVRRSPGNQLAIRSQMSSSAQRWRREQRFTATGGVNVREVGAAGTPQWAMLHDISIGGCYVETTSPLPPLTRVELTVQTGNLVIECKGSVTVKHPLVGMGIKFTDMTPPNRDALLHLIAGLEQEAALVRSGAQASD